MYISWFKPLQSDGYLPLIGLDANNQIWAVASGFTSSGSALYKKPSLNILGQDGQEYYSKAISLLSPEWRTDGWNGYNYFLPVSLIINEESGYTVAGNDYVALFSDEATGDRYKLEDYILRVSAIRSTGPEDLYISGQYGGYNGRVDGWGYKTPGFVSRITSRGEPIWKTYLGDPNQQESIVSDIEILPNGSIIASGYSGESGIENPQSFLVNIDESGNKQWEMQLGTKGESEYIRDIVVGEDGYIYATGIKTTNATLYSSSSGGSLRGFISRITPTGDLVWTRTIGNGHTKLHAVSVDNQGNISVGGETWEEYGGSKKSWDGFIARYDSGGNEISTFTFGSTREGSGHDVVTGLVADPEGKYLIASGMSEPTELIEQYNRGIDRHAYSDWNAYVSKIILEPEDKPEQETDASKWSMDLNADGEISALSDGLILASYLNDISVDAIPDAIIGSSSPRSGTELEQYLEAGVSSGLLDVDGDQSSPTNQDLMMIIRYAFGTFPGSALLSNLQGPALTDSDLPAVKAALMSIF